MASKINKDGKTEIKLYLKSALESLAEVLDKNGSLNSVQPQLELIWKTIYDIENNWEEIETKGGKIKIN